MPPTLIHRRWATYSLGASPARTRDPILPRIAPLVAGRHSVSLVVRNDDIAVVGSLALADNDVLVFEPGLRQAPRQKSTVSKTSFNFFRLQNHGFSETTRRTSASTSKPAKSASLNPPVWSAHFPSPLGPTYSTALAASGGARAASPAAAAPPSKVLLETRRPSVLMRSAGVAAPDLHIRMHTSSDHGEASIVYRLYSCLLSGIHDNPLQRRCNTTCPSFGPAASFMGGPGRRHTLKQLSGCEWA